MTPSPTIHHSQLHGSGLDLYQAHTLAGIGAFAFMFAWVGLIALVEHWGEIKVFIYKFRYTYEKFTIFRNINKR